jgi:hypothetical protein
MVGPLGTEFAPPLHQRVKGNPFPKRLRRNNHVFDVVHKRNIQLHPFLPVSYPILRTTAGAGTAPFTAGYHFSLLAVADSRAGGANRETYAGTSSVRPAVTMSITAQIRSKFTQAFRRIWRPTFS